MAKKPSAEHIPDEDSLYRWVHKEHFQDGLLNPIVF